MPLLKLLDEDSIDRIINAGFQLLEEIGVKFYNDRALKILSEGGAEVDFKNGIAKIPRELAEECLKKAPKEIKLYSRDGDKTYETYGDNVFYAPGSAAIRVVDPKTGEIRDPLARDFADFVRLVEALEYIELQSTAIVPSDVPDVLADRFRLYIVLNYSNKPVYTGAFTIDGVIDMKDMLAAVSGGEEELAKKPRAVFTCCPSPPFKWSEVTSQNVIDCAKYMIPSSVLPMPIIGLAAPPTIAGGLVQHVAEFLSGLCLAQMTRPGAPVYFGGSPGPSDPRYGTTLMGAIETSMMCCALAQIGKKLGLPTDMYIGLTNSKIMDEQAAAESVIGLILGALAGINLIEGTGMIEFESCQSFEKMVLDNDVCGMIYRLLKGIDTSEEALAIDIMRDVGAGGEFMKSAKAIKMTLERYMKEIFMPSKAISTEPRRVWEMSGAKNAMKRIKERIKEILEKQEPNRPSEDVRRELDEIMDRAAKKYGYSLEKLPKIP